MPSEALLKFTSIDELQAAMRERHYIAERGLATSLYLALKLGRPVFLEGEAGVGKTEVAKVLAALLDTELIRLQCYEGLDVHHAVYEWNYTRQMMHIRLLEARGDKTTEAELFGEEVLLCEIAECRDQLALGQISARAKNHHHARISGLVVRWFRRSHPCPRNQLPARGALHVAAELKAHRGKHFGGEIALAA